MDTQCNPENVLEEFEKLLRLETCTYSKEELEQLTLWYFHMTATLECPAPCALLPYLHLRLVSKE